MNEKHLKESLDLIRMLALSSRDNCDEVIPPTIVKTLDLIVSLACYKSVDGDLLSEQDRELFKGDEL